MFSWLIGQRLPDRVLKSLIKPANASRTRRSSRFGFTCFSSRRIIIGVAVSRLSYAVPPCLPVSLPGRGALLPGRPGSLSVAARDVVPAAVTGTMGAVSGSADTQAQREPAAASGVSWIPTLTVINGSRGDDVARHLVLGFRWLTRRGIWALTGRPGRGEAAVGSCRQGPLIEGRPSL